jgi:peptidoglycan/LPS O-acetylase OafA/YrhL
MPLRLDSIDIGVLAAYIKFYRPASWKRNPKKLALGGALLLAALTVYFGFAYARHYDAVNWDHFFKAGLFLETLFFTLISLSIAMLFPWLCSLSVKAGYFSRAVTFVSLISYSIYLTHFAIIIVVAYVFKHYTHLWYVNVLMFVIIWVATMFVSAVQYNYFEVKMTALRNKISRKQAAIKI